MDILIKLNNGVLIPKIGLGTYLMTDEDNTYEIIKKALEVGYRHIDTAMMYGNEAIIGKAIKDSKISRSELFITTKIHYHYDPDTTISMVEERLKNLQLEYLDLLLIHWPNHDDSINIQTWKVFEDFYKRGIIRAIGVSNFTRYQLDKLLSQVDIKPVINQIEFHPALSQEPMQMYLNEKNIAITGYGPLMRGKIHDEPYKSIFDKIAEKHQCTRAQVVIAWVLSKGVIVIPKTATISRLAENFQAINIILTDEEVKAIDQLNTGKRLYSDPSNNIYGRFKSSK